MTQGTPGIVEAETDGGGGGDTPSAGNSRPTRRLPVGAELLPRPQASSPGGAHFRVWAPNSTRVTVLLGGAALPGDCEHEIALPPDAGAGGYYSGHVGEARAGMVYRLQLDHGAYPDPVSRYQPEGPHGPSQLVDPASFPWTDDGWKGVPRAGMVIYELHVGTFTQEGTWQAAMRELPALADLGITMVEVMPVADFSGTRGWGYDGVNLFAPTRLYGTPDDFRAFVNEAHRLGMGVMLDLVYNHLGPDGNYLTQFSRDYFHPKHMSAWGDALNFDDSNSGPVREFFCANAAYWIDEYHLDGLRLDATHQIFDDTEYHILAQIGVAARDAAKGRDIFIVAESEHQDGRLVRPASEDGYGLDAIWNDDFHHCATVALTGRTEAFFSAYQGVAQEFVSAAKWGFLYQGQRCKYSRARRGAPSLDLGPGNFVTFIQNHDQVASPQLGRRLHTVASAGSLRAMTALLLLGPNIPMLFQGQEFAATAPFLYFADHNHNPDLAQAVTSGRAEFLSPFAAFAGQEPVGATADPQAEETFLRCKLDFSDRQRNAALHQMHRDLIHLRRRDPLIGCAARAGYDGAVLGPKAFLLRYFGREDNDRLLIVNLGPDLDLDPVPEPLLSPVRGGHVWQVHWSSEDVAYGGGGSREIELEERWQIPTQSAVLLVPRKE